MNGQSSGNFSFSIPIVLLCGMLLSLAACAGRTELPSTQVEHFGQFPSTGTVALRSGMSWMNETSGLFQDLQAALSPLLAAKGLVVARVAPSSLAPLPEGLREHSEEAGNNTSLTKPFSNASTTVRLERYVVPEHDKDLPPSVMRMRPKDVSLVAYALSQVRDGYPLLLNRKRRIPGRLPMELRTRDAGSADYALVCRFAAIVPLQNVLQSSWPDVPLRRLIVTTPLPQPQNRLADFITAAGSIRGVRTMGYGTSAPAAPPRSYFGASPGDYRRGYEGMSPIPGDPWHREADFKARNYPGQHNLSPSVATPPQEFLPLSPPTSSFPASPKPPLPGENDWFANPREQLSGMPASRLTRSGHYDGAAAQKSDFTSSDNESEPVAGYALELELYTLAPVREGADPRLVWQTRVWQSAEAPSLGVALPGMCARALKNS